MTPGVPFGLTFPMSTPATYRTALLDEITKELGLKTELAQLILPVMLSNLQKLDGKQQDYGAENLHKFGTFGVVVRMNDKMERIVNLSKKSGASTSPVNESMQDSFLDLSNYGLIAYVIDNGSFRRK